MDENKFSFARYLAELLVGFSRNLYDETGRWRPIGWLIVVGVALGWAVFPFEIMTCVHPSDVIRLHAKMLGLTPPDAFTASQLASGFVQAVVAGVVLVVFQLVGTVLFYRRARLFNVGAVAAPVLWPLGAILTGILGNACWLVGTGQFDWFGCLIGFTPVVLAELCEWVVEGLGRDLIFGPAIAGQHY
jgi:hypothetical protein